MIKARRVFSAVAGTLLAVGTFAAPAMADQQLSATTTTPITGSFTYSDLAAGPGSINNPVSGICYTVPTVALSGFNGTNANATTYTDINCSVLGVAVPAKSQTRFAFSSVVFN